MDRPNTWTIRVFRNEPGDLAIPDIIVFANVLTAEHATGQRLQSYFDDTMRPGPMKPHHALLLGRQDQVITSYEITPHGEAKRAIGGMRGPAM